MASVEAQHPVLGCSVRLIDFSGKFTYVNLPDGRGMKVRIQQSLWGLIVLGAACLPAPAMAGITGFTLTASGSLTEAVVSCNPSAGLDPCPFTPIPVGAPLIAGFSIYFDTPLSASGVHVFTPTLVAWQTPEPGDRRNQGYIDTADPNDSWNGWQSYESGALAATHVSATIRDGQLTRFDLRSVMQTQPASSPCQVAEFNASNGAFSFLFAQFCFFQIIGMEGEGSYEVTMHYEPTPGPSPAVPEPATWAMLIAGFGMIGATLRRRRQAAC